MSLWGQELFYTNGLPYKDSIFLGVLHHHSGAFIGPHEKEVLSILVGSLLGDLGAEMRNSTRFKFWQGSVHTDYLLWLYSFLSARGYCSPKVPLVKDRKSTVGSNPTRAVYFWTCSFASLNWLFAAFYATGIKAVPRGDFLYLYLDPLALAVWAMDDGGKVGSGFKFCTHSFTKDDVEYLVTVLSNKYNLKCTVQDAGEVKEQYHIYIWASSMDDFRSIVTPYFHPSMLYKLA